MIPSIPAGRLLGVPLRIGVSWLVVIPLVGIGLFAGIPIGAGSVFWRVAVATGGTLLIFVSVVLHEVGHVAAARRFGVQVAHTRVFLVGGYSDMDLDDISPRAEITVAVAGPVVSVVMALVLGGIAVITPDRAGLHRVVGAVVIVNLALAAGNLLPGLPLDGGRVLRGMFRGSGRSGPRAERAARWIGFGVGIALTAFGFVAAFLGRATSLLIAPAGMLLVLLTVGVPIQPVGRVAGAMRPLGRAVPETEPVAGLTAGPFPVPVVRGTRVVGLVMTAGTGLAGEVMTPVGAGDLVAPDDDLDEVRTRLARNQRPLLVVDHGRLVGIVELADLEPVTGG